MTNSTDIYNTNSKNSNSTDSYNTNSKNLDYLIPLFFAVVLLLFLILYCLRSRYMRQYCRICPENPTDLEEPLIHGERVIYRQGFLVKRCDQASTRNVEEHIISRVRQQTLVSSWDRDEDDGQRPVIVFCVISSRIGTDIENAMRGVNGNSRVILVLLHCVLSSLLRGDLSDDEELLDPTMIKRMAGIAHFAFSDREGLYSCRQNTAGFDLLSDLVRQ